MSEATAGEGDQAYGFPLSHEQRRLWFMDRLHPESSLYNIQQRLRFGGLLDEEALRSALRRTLERHEILRTTYTRNDGEPVQVVGDVDPDPLAVVDLTDVADGDREEQLRRIALEDHERPFDLESGPVCRFTLVRLGPRDHALVLTVHHIAFDGWSIDLLLDELETLYHDYREGDTPSLDPPPLQYGDYAAWQRQRFEGDALEDALAFWRETLEDPPDVDLPFDDPRPPEKTHEGGRARIELPPEVRASIEHLAREQRASLFMTLLAGFKLFLHRHTPGDDLLVSAPVHTRSHENLESIPGLFVNRVLLRTQTSGNPTFRELVDRVRETCLSALENKHAPLEEVVAAVDPDRERGHDPLAKVSFRLREAPSLDDRFPDLEVESFEDDHAPTEFDLAIEVVDDGDRLRVLLFYDSDLFREETIERMIDRFSLALRAVADDPDQLLSDVDVLPERERERLRRTAVGADLSYPRDETFHALFEEQTRRTPERTALVFGERRITYRELEERANRLAHALQDRGVGAETPVAIALERSPAYVVAILATLKAGGCYVPLDPSAPAQRNSYILREVDPGVVVTDERDVDAVPPDASVLDLGTDAIAERPSTPPETDAGPGDLAYVIFTSGSTGRPKGVQVSHRNCLCFAYGIDEAIYAPLRERLDRPLELTLGYSFAFDASVKQLVRLLYGDTLLLVDGETRREPGELLAFLEDHRPDTFNCVTSQLATLAGTGLLEEDACPHVLVFGGEEVSDDLWRRLGDCEHVEAFNVYGATECAVNSTVARVEPDTRPTIGGPLPNARTYVVDEHGNPAPVGVPGEIHIGGEGVARGYLDTERTEERFGPDPFASDPDARVYRTGDLGRWRPDGTLAFLGREDDQVQVRGYRVEPGEVEAALAAHPDVNQAVVVARDDGPTRGLVAYHEPAKGSDPPASDSLRSFLTDRLPSYMVPPHLVSVDDFPRMPSGKVDRDALPEPEGRPTLDQAYAAPRTPVEETVADVWSKVLDVDRVGVHDDFFDLGGHSLLAVQTVTRVEDAFGVDVPVKALFSNPTVGELASHVEQRVQEAVASMSREEIRRKLSGSRGDGQR